MHQGPQLPNQTPSEASHRGDLSGFGLVRYTFDLREAHFEHFGGMCPDTTRMSLSNLILTPFGGLGPDNGLQNIIFSIFAAWPQMWPEWASESIFLVFWWPSPRCGQNGHQNVHFKHVDGLSPDIAIMCRRSHTETS